MSKPKHLIDYFIPETYTLDITSDSIERTFGGTVTIAGTLGAKATDTIYVHASDLNIVSITINGNSAEFTSHSELEEVAITLPDTKVKDIELVVTYDGKMSDGMTGIYPCPYLDGKTEKVIIGTQFESHYARKAFPCIDEPAAKAVFNITLHTRNGETVLSNTEVTTSSKAKEFTKTTFAPTPRMSTYLVAFAHGDIASLESKTKNGTIVRTWSTPDNVNYTAHSLDVGVKTLEFLEDYFAIPYPLSKCDMIGLPNFSAGAMENWGLITYREASLFVDPANTTQFALEHVTMTVVHELVHQWFGNLVTMKWWNDLWLNEGFASFMPYIVMDELFPAWNVWTQFLNEDFMGAQSLDALENSHPIEVTINDPDEIRTIFDSISYDKGASVLNMLHTYLGAQDFRDGLRLYLKTHAYQNTTTKDLWASLAEVSGKPVEKFMKAWTSQTGYPVVQVEQDMQAGTINLTQERFLINKRKREAEKDTTLWPVPITVVGSNEHFQLAERSQSWQPPTGDVFNQKFNTHHDGFYMTRYSSEHLSAIAQQIKQGKLSVRDRIGVLHDTFELAKAGYVSTDEALGLFASFENETDPFVWDILAGQLGSLRLVMDSDELRDTMKPFILAMIENQYQELGWDEVENEPYYNTIKRPTILSLGVSAQHAEITKEALSRFKQAKNPDDLAPNTRSVVYGAVARNSSEADYKKLLGFYETTKSPQEVVKIAAALCSFEEKDLYTKSIAMIKSNQVKAQDIPYWIAYSFANRFARADAWKWFTEEWEWLQKTFESDVSLLAYLPRYAGRVFSSDSFAKEYEAFFTDNTPKGVDRQIRQTIESIEWHADWKKRDYKKILQFFQDTSSK